MEDGDIKQTDNKVSLKKYEISTILGHRQKGVTASLVNKKCWLISNRILWALLKYFKYKCKNFHTGGEEVNTICQRKQDLAYRLQSYVAKSFQIAKKSLIS